ncbi:MAG: cobalamin B12-binding domain-containing protein [Rhodobacteraceae bacterium]|nr:cobalamin B12-binding domain-containing protein [Paracoccaceae bacterium]
MAHDDQRMTMRGGGGKSAAVGSFALEVVSVLNDRQAEIQKGAVRAYLTDIVRDRVTCRGDFDSAALLSELRSFRLSDDAIIDNYIPVVAREIGQLWVNNEMSFADVTIASVRLQSLLTEVAYCRPMNDMMMPTAIHALMVICEGDQHSLGGFVAAAQLRRRSASVEVICNAPEEDIVAQICEGGFDAVMFSCSRPRSLESAGRVVQEVKRNMTDAPVFALGGIVLNEAANAQQVTEVDIVASDVGSVLGFCHDRAKRVSGKAPG